MLLQQLFGYWTNGPLSILILNTRETDKVKGAIRLIYTCPDLASHDRARDYRSPKIGPPGPSVATFIAEGGLPDQVWLP